MPFKSKSQLRTCYGRRPKGWDCDKWLKETPSVCCLPEKKGLPVKSRCMSEKKDGNRTITNIQTGARGGRFFVIEENDNRGQACLMKVYLPKNKK